MTTEQPNWKEQFDEKFIEEDDASIDGSLRIKSDYAFQPEEIKNFISTEIIEKLIEDGKKAINELRQEQPSNIEHPHYYQFLNEWEANEITLNEVEQAVEQLRDKWL